MSASIYQRGPPCGVDNCPETRYREGDDGYLYCRRGHRSERHVAFGTDDFEASQAARTRTRREREAVERIAATIDGREAYELCFICFQLIIRKQVAWLIKVKDYPAELEGVVRDLWILRLSLLKDRLNKAGVREESGEDGEDEEEAPLYSTQVDEERGIDGNSSDDDGSADASDALRRSKYSQFQALQLNLLETLGLTYLGLMLLRFPVSMASLQSWVESQELIYLNAIETVPRTMRQRLPVGLRPTLNAQYLPSRLAYHTTAEKLAEQLYLHHGLEISPLNYPLVLFRLIATLALPLEVFAAVRRLAELLSHSFTFAKRRKAQRRRLIDLPEPGLAALVVVTVRILYPFESTKIYPRTKTEPYAFAIDWEAWNKVSAAPPDMLQQDRIPKDSSRFQRTTEEDVFVMGDKQLDDYLDWYERTWTSNQPVPEGTTSQAAFRKVLLDTFPLQWTSRDDMDTHDENIELPASGDVDMNGTGTISQKLSLVQGAMQPRRIKDDARARSKVARPGSHYEQYLTEEDIPAVARPFFAAVADLVGLDVNSLVSAVHEMEYCVYIYLSAARSNEDINTEIVERP